MLDSSYNVLIVNEKAGDLEASAPLGMRRD